MHCYALDHRSSHVHLDRNLVRRETTFVRDDRRRLRQAAGQTVRLD